MWREAFHCRCLICDKGSFSRSYSCCSLPPFFFSSSLFLLFFSASSILPLINFIICLYSTAFDSKRYVSRGKRCRRVVSPRARFFARTRTFSRINATRHARLSRRRGINAPGDGCFDSRYWNSIDGEKILIISTPFLSALWRRRRRLENAL